MTPAQWALGSAVLLAGLVASFMVMLFVYKVGRNRRAAFAEVRRAAYIAAMGEMAYRGGYPQDMLQGWVNDRVFREVVVEYLKFLTGAHRHRVLRFANDIGISELLHKELSSMRKGLRSAAAEGLSQLGDEDSVPFLLEALTDKEQGVKINAAHALARVGRPETLPAVMAAMAGGSDWVRSRVADALITFGPTAIVPISLVLDHPQTTPETKRLLIQVLGQIGDPIAEPILLSGLNSGDLDVRVRSTAALATAGSPSCVPSLIETLSDPDWRVRAQAATSLNVRMDPLAIPALKAALGDEGWWVRQNAATALTSIPGGQKALLAALDDPDQFARDVAPEYLMGSQIMVPDSPEGIEIEIDRLEEIEREQEVVRPEAVLYTGPASQKTGPKHAAVKPRHHNPRHRAPSSRDRSKGRHRP